MGRQNPDHRGAYAPRHAGVSDAELAKRRLAGEDWCAAHNDGAGGFVKTREMSANLVNQCRACVNARQNRRNSERELRRKNGAP